MNILEIVTMKVVICNQQNLIENHEQKIRACNLIVHNIIEEEVFSSSRTFKNDKEKIQALIQFNNLEIKVNEVISRIALQNRTEEIGQTEYVP